MATQHSKPDDSSPSEKSNPSKAKLDTSPTGVVKLAMPSLRLFHTADRQPFARIWIKGHWETYPIRSSLFADWLSGLCYHRHGVAPAQRTVSAAISVLASDAVFANDEKQIYVRVASCDGAIYVDLANSSWEAVRITADGWEIVPHTPVIFWRPPGMQALPRPERGGAITELRQFLNLENEDQWILYVGWLLGALQPKGPFPLLILQGVHGSAKSTNTRVLRSLLDPNEAAIRSEPGTTRDLMISAKNSRCLAFDNLSFLSSPLCDALCRLSTGGGFSTRALYTDDGEKIFQGTRPVILNGIDLGIERADLLDRAICLCHHSSVRTLARPKRNSGHDSRSCAPAF